MQADFPDEILKIPCIEGVTDFLDMRQMRRR